MCPLSVSDLVAAEAEYHKSRRSGSENSPSSRLTPGRLSLCCKFEDEMEIYTLTEFHDAMSNLLVENN